MVENARLRVFKKPLMVHPNRMKDMELACGVLHNMLGVDLGSGGRIGSGGKSLFRSLSRFNLRKLQCVQNSAARIVSKTTKFSSITIVLKTLHWLPIEQKTIFKTSTLVYKYFSP